MALCSSGLKEHQLSSGKKNPMDDAVAEALRSVERLENTEPAATVASSDSSSDEDFDPDSIQVLQADDLPPSADPNAKSDAAPLAVDGLDEDILLEDDGDDPPPKKPSAQDAILQSMIEAKNEAVGALEQTQKEAASMRERLMRVSAEFDNYKKRQSRERQDAIKFANEGLLKELLPVLDNFDRALTGMKSSAEDSAAAANMLQGVEMVARQFKDTLAKVGVEEFSALGQPFDPSLHEAVSAREDPSVPNNTVVEEYQRGYKLNGRLVRPSMVIVSTGGASGKVQAAPGAEDDE